MKPEKLIPVILCGGSGERLRPLSSPERPKQFLKLLSDRSLLQETAMRAVRAGRALPSDIVTVTLSALKSQVLADYREIEPGLENHIISEPFPRNTAAAILSAVLYVKKFFGPGAMIWILPSDHHIAREDVLARDLRRAVRVARRNFLVTFGIRPSRADVNYGYMRARDLMIGGEALFVDEFTEKPSADLAAAYVRSGRYFWNSGMFVFTVEAVLNAFKLHAPELYGAILQNNYAAAPSVAFDHAILEKSGQVAVVPSDPGWSDVGSWETLWDIGVRKKCA